MGYTLLSIPKRAASRFLKKEGMFWHHKAIARKIYMCMLNYQRSLKYEHALMYRRKCREKTSHSVHKRTVVRRYGWNDNITFTVQPCPYPGCQACNVLMNLLKNRLKFKSLVHRFICWSVLGHWIVLLAKDWPYGSTSAILKFVTAGQDGASETFLLEGHWGLSRDIGLMYNWH